MLMGLFSKKQPAAASFAAPLSAHSKHPFLPLERFSPLTGTDHIGVYRALREAVPVIDAAVLKLIRLTGGFQVTCPRAGDQEALNRFAASVPVGRAQKGLDSFLEQWLDSLLTCGQAAGEIVLSQEPHVQAVLCADVRSVEVCENGDGLSFTLARREADGTLLVPKRQDLLLFGALNPEPEHPYGVSLLRGMPYMANLLLKIFHATGENWDRAGRARYAVICREPGELGDAQERAQDMARQWSQVMQDTGRVRDFVAIGDIDIRSIGADGQILNSETPVRQILEQIIARTGIPPFLLGLNWSSTERMSSQQADILTSEITALRRNVTPVLTTVLHLFQNLRGQPQDAAIDWNPVNLQDEVEEARADLYRANAQKLRGETP